MQENLYWFKASAHGLYYHLLKSSQCVNETIQGEDLEKHVLHLNRFKIEADFYCNCMITYSMGSGVVFIMLAARRARV